MRGAAPTRSSTPLRGSMRPDEADDRPRRRAATAARRGAARARSGSRRRARAAGRRGARRRPASRRARRRRAATAAGTRSTRSWTCSTVALSRAAAPAAGAPHDRAVEVDDVVAPRRAAAPRGHDAHGARALAPRPRPPSGSRVQPGPRGAAASRSGPAPGVVSVTSQPRVAQARQQPQQPDLGAAGVVDRRDGEQGRASAATLPAAVRLAARARQRRHPGRATRRRRSGGCSTLLRGQTAAHEVVVVDSGSRDGTADVARRRGRAGARDPAAAFTLRARAEPRGGGGGGGRGRRAVRARVPARRRLARARWRRALRRPGGRLRVRRDARLGRARRCASAVRQDAALAARAPVLGLLATARAPSGRRCGASAAFREDLPGTEDREWALWALRARAASACSTPRSPSTTTTRATRCAQSFRALRARGARLRDVPRPAAVPAAATPCASGGPTRAGTARARARGWTRGASRGWPASGGARRVRTGATRATRAVARGSGGAGCCSTSCAPGDAWLDLGCGAGRFLELAPGGVGVDVADAALSAPRRGRAATARRTATLPLDHASVDLVWCSEVIEHVADALGAAVRGAPRAAPRRAAAADHARAPAGCAASRSPRCASTRTSTRSAGHLRFFTRALARAPRSRRRGFERRPHPHAAARRSSRGRCAR